MHGPRPSIKPRPARRSALQGALWRSYRETAGDRLQHHATAALADQRMMGRAIAQAQRAARMDEVPVGAVVVFQGAVIAEACNTRESSQDPTDHAEMTAIRLAAAALNSWRLNDCTLYVTLEPCPMCAGAIVNARIGRLVYGATDPKMGAVSTLYQLCTDRRLNHRVAVRRGVCAAECGQLLSAFFRRRRAARRAMRPRR
jgi:tRNA(adenine34) deaminase